MINIIVDITLLLIVFFGLILGIKRGFVKTVAKPVKIVLALVIAFSFAAPLSEAVVEPIVEAPLENQISDYINENCSDLTADNLNEELPTVLKMAAGVFDIDLTEFSDDPDVLAEEIVDILISPAIHLISTFFTFIILYLVSSLVLSILLSILSSVFDVGFVGTVNKILGAVFSTAFSIILAWLAATIFTYLLHIPAISAMEWAKEFDGGAIYKLFNNLNPVDLILGF